MLLGSVVGSGRSFVSPEALSTSSAECSCSNGVPRTGESAWQGGASAGTITRRSDAELIFSVLVEWRLQRNRKGRSSGLLRT